MNKLRNLSIILAFTAIGIQIPAQKFWLTTYEFPNGPKTAITLSRDTCLFVAYQTGVLRSFNEGGRFEPSLSTRSVFSLFSSSAGKVYAGGSGKIFSTTNMGESWDSVAVSTTYPVLQLIENKNGGLFAITGALTNEDGFVGAGVFYSDSEGLTWQQRNNGLGIYTSCEHIACDKNGRLYLTVADEYNSGNGGLFISDNNGLNWEHIGIRIDGKNAINDDISIGNTTGLSVSPDDSLYLSFTGVAGSASVRMNIRKHINDIRNTDFWHPLKISESNMWWADKALNNIFYARNGDRYSSNTNSINQGGTFFMKNNTKTWKRIDYGLGLDIYSSRSAQQFAETSKGKVFMIQMLDERVYWADTSRVSAVEPVKYPVSGLSVFPTVVRRGEKLAVRLPTDNAESTVAVYTAGGVLLFSVPAGKQTIEIKAPENAGSYFIVMKNRNQRIPLRFVVV